MNDKDTVLEDGTISSPSPIQIKTKDTAENDAVMRTLIDEWVVPQLIREYLSHRCGT
jgi:hypothetical protein